MKGFKKGAKKFIAIVLSLAISFPALTISVSAKTDIENHWAGNTIKEWIEKGLATGYGDGSFKPDNSITRAEFMNLVNNAFGYSAEAEIQFSDVAEGVWYYNVIQKAVAAGYLGGYPDGTMQPNKLISRQEAAIVIAKVKALTPNTDAVMNFTDSSEMASWSNGYIGAVREAGLMRGYSDGSFKPTAQIKRAEAIVALNHAMRTVIYDKAGTYGPVIGAEKIEGNVVIKADGVILQNLIITGSLTIDEGVGQGDVTLNNIVVNGETYIRAGGKNSIHINGGQYNRIIIQETAGGAVRIVAIDVEGADIVIAEEAAGETIILEGKFDSILLQANQVALQTQGNTEILSMTVSEDIKDSTILIGANTTVTKLSIESPIKVRGDGRIIAVDVKATGVVFDKAPLEINVTEGIQPPVVENTSNNTGGSSTPRTQTITGVLTASAGAPDLSVASIQLKQSGVDVGSVIHPAANGTYSMSGVLAGEDYIITARLDGYYDFATAAFTVTQGTNITGKELQVARKEPIITTQNSTTITKGVSGASIVIDLTSGEDHPAQIINLGHTFAEDATVTNPANWTVSTGTTGLTLESITRNSDTQVTLSFTGDATNARSFSIQADAGTITGSYAFDSNVLTFSVVEDDLIIDATGAKEIYYAKNIEVDGPMKAVVVIVHGLAEHLGRYNEITEALNTAGYGVYRLDNKGHGETGIANGDSGNVEAFAEYYEDIDIIVEMAKADNPGKPVYMLGHSMGGLLTAAYGVTYTDKLAGQIISGGATGPYYMAFGLDDEAFYAAVGGAEALVANSLTSTVCRYPAIQAYYYVDPLRLTSYTRKLQWETFGAGSKYLEDQIIEGNYTYPVFIFHGGDDRIVSKAFSENLYSNISSVDKTLEIYQGLYHESLNERNEKATVMSDIIDWLNVRVD